ncbi:MAG: TIGR00730 family Rossman fold protein [Muribaculaceae bacterium]|nr:TIGR00730 family Rossman fold protein [Muribaculaceae bacterium]
MNQAITVYCGSASDCKDIYIEAARELGREIALSGAGLITGAGRTGLMGAIADACAGAGGHTIGIIPQFMVDRGWHNAAMDELTVTDSMHSRKAMMARRATGVIALPGGIGTFEELCEIMTWRQLGLFSGNIVIYNVAGYYDPLMAMFEKAIDEGFMKNDHRGLFFLAESAAEAVAAALATDPETTFSAKF